MRMRNILIARDGTSVSGVLLEKTIAITTLLGRHRIPRSAIAWIHFKGTPTATVDEIWLHNGDRLSGTILGRSVRWRDSSKNTHVIPFQKIHSIVLSSGAI